MKCFLPRNRRSAKLELLGSVQVRPVIVLILVVCFTGVPLGGATTVNAQQVEPTEKNATAVPTTLQLAIPNEREIGAGEIHKYSLHVAPGQYVRAVVERAAGLS